MMSSPHFICHFQFRPTVPPAPCAIATMYHSGQTSDQFRVHKPLLLGGRIINVVIAIARKIAKAKLIRINRKAWRTPQIAGRRKRNRQSLERDGSLNRTKQNKHAKQDEALLTQSVRRDSDPMTKPQAQEQPISSRPRQRSCKKPSWIACEDPMRILWSMRRSYLELTDTETPIRIRLPGSASPNTANHGCQFFQCDNCRRTTSPSTSSKPCQAPSPVSSKSPSTASRSSRSSSSAATSTNGQCVLVTTLSRSGSPPTTRGGLRA